MNMDLKMNKVNIYMPKLPPEYADVKPKKQYYAGANKPLHRRIGNISFNYDTEYYKALHEPEDSTLSNPRWCAIHGDEKEGMYISLPPSKEGYQISINVKDKNFIIINDQAMENEW